MSFLTVKQQLQFALGFDAARSPSDSINERDITQLIDTDIPEVNTLAILYNYWLLGLYCC